MKRLLLVLLLLALPSTLRANDITLRTTVTKKSLELTVVHGTDADVRMMSAALASENFVRISSILLDPSSCSLQHLFIWRRPPAGEYVIEVSVFDRDGRIIQSGFTRLFVF